MECGGAHHDDCHDEFGRLVIGEQDTLGNQEYQGRGDGNDADMSGIATASLPPYQERPYEDEDHHIEDGRRKGVVLHFAAEQFLHVFVVG